MSRGLLNMCSRCAHSNSNTCIYLPALSARALIDKQGIYSLYKVTPRRLPSARNCALSYDTGPENVK